MNKDWIDIKIGLNNTPKGVTDVVGMLKILSEDLGWVVRRCDNDSDYKFFIRPKKEVISPNYFKRNFNIIDGMVEIIAKLRYKSKSEVPEPTYTFFSREKIAQADTLRMKMEFGKTLRLSARIVDILELEKASPDIAELIFHKKLKYLLEDAKKSFTRKEKNQIFEWYDIDIEGHILGILILKRLALKIKNKLRKS
ncbi:MAG: hypothetical protein M0R03_21515 [Novosphingobium sp.]|nr:hypothetical protein [Novosphingobium sp.]